MNKFLFLVFVGLFLSMPTHAELLDEEGEIIPGEGPKGRYTREQLRPHALNIMPGELLEDRSYWREDKLLHEYTIEMEDGSIYEVEYYAYDADLYEIEAQKLAEKDPILPPGMFEQKKVETVALLYAKTRIKGALKPRIEDVTVRTYEQNLIYAVKISKGVRDYEILIDGFEGHVLRHDEID